MINTIFISDVDFYEADRTNFPIIFVSDTEQFYRVVEGVAGGVKAIEVIHDKA